MRVRCLRKGIDIFIYSVLGGVVLMDRDGELSDPGAHQRMWLAELAFELNQTWLAQFLINQSIIFAKLVV